MQMIRLKMNPIAAMVVWIMLTLFFHPNPVGAAPFVTADKEVHPYGERIKVHFSGAPGNDSDWICIVPAGSPDTEAGDYQYMPISSEQRKIVFSHQSISVGEANLISDVLKMSDAMIEALLR